MSFDAIRRLPSQAAPSLASQDELNNSFGRLVEVLQEENTILESNQSIDDGRFIERKNTILRDIILFQRMHPNVERNLRDLTELKALLDRNAILLKSSIKAVKVVAETALSASHDEDSDMTYSSQERFRNFAS